jgi:hypothetical protein
MAFQSCKFYQIIDGSVFPQHNSCKFIEALFDYVAWLHKAVKLPALTTGLIIHEMALSSQQCMIGRRQPEPCENSSEADAGKK